MLPIGLWQSAYSSITMGSVMIKKEKAYFYCQVAHIR